MTVEEAQRHAAAEPAQARYRELRAEHGESLEGQLALARWCRRNNLDDEARFHWASVLSVQPGNEEALRSLDVRWHNGQLASRDEVAKSKEQMREWKRAAKTVGFQGCEMGAGGCGRRCGRARGGACGNSRT